MFVFIDLSDPLKKNLFLKMIIYPLHFNVHKKGAEFPGLHFELLRCEYSAHSNL